MTARSIVLAASVAPNACSSNMATDAIAPIGLALSLPAMSGADPCTGSKSPGPFANAGRWQQTDRSHDHGGFVRQDVSEQVLGQHDIELRGRSDEGHGARVDVHMRQSDVRVVGRDGSHDSPPELRRLEDVRFVHGRDLLPPAACGVERDACDACDLLGGVAHRVERGVPIRRESAGLREVQPAGQLANDEQIGVLRDLGLQRACVFTAWPETSRPQVGVDAESTPQREQPALRPFGGRQMIERRIADGAEKHRLRGPAGVERRRRKRRQAVPQGHAADRVTTLW